MTMSDRFQMFHTSVYAGMYEYLAETLGSGITVHGIRTLGVGFDYKYQAWVIPERNVFGDIIGLSYRYTDGRKTMAPVEQFSGRVKNRRGLTYPFNQNYDSGEKRYSPGRHNWVRIGDAGVRCPICDKPDWCVVSAENPSDPQAVLCKRIEEGSVKETEGGFLHIRKSSGRLTAAAKLVLPPSDFPLIIVEGASDVIAALSLGFIAIGRPNCGACTGLLSKMPLAGREVWVIGENDAGAGIKGMEETFAVARRLTPDVKMFLPPEGVKDLRSWVNAGLTFEELVEYAYDNGTNQSSFDIDVFPNAQPVTIARAFIDQTKVDDKPTIALLKGKHYKWNGTMYTELDQTELHRNVLMFMEGKKITVETTQGEVVKSLPTTSKWMHDVINCLPVQAPLATHPNVWLSERHDRPPVDQLISFQNGILDVGEYVESGKIKFYDSDPDLFVLGSFPYAFVPNVECKDFEKFILEVQDNDHDTLRMLQQWAGYTLVPDMTLEKLILLTGKPRSGKGTIMETMQAMLGTDLCTALKMNNFTTTFGQHCMVGKLLGVLGDVKSLRASEQQMALATILQIVGGDAININRKYAEEISNLHLTIRFMMGMNELPRFHDDSMAFAARALPIRFNKSWLGKEDWSLKPRIIALAKEGHLINWALRGLRDLRQSHGFIIPKRTQTQIDLIKGANSPLRVFVDEVCTLEPEGVVKKSLLYDVWKGWCHAQDQRAGSRESFGRVLVENIDGVALGRVRIDKKREYVYTGIKLNHDAIEDYVD